MTRFFLIGLLSAGLISCQEKIVIEGTPENVFEVFWNTLNERYVHFPDKDIDWDAVYLEYMPRFREVKSEDELEELFREVMFLLEDNGLEVFRPLRRNIIFSTIRYRPFHIDYFPSIFEVIIERYGFELVANEYKYAVYRHADKGYVYLRYARFTEGFNEEGLIEVLNGFDYSGGLIVDVSWNSLERKVSPAHARQFTSLFFDRDGTHYYYTFRAGPGHDNYSEPSKASLPAYRNLPDGWLQFSEVPVVLLIGYMTAREGAIFSSLVSEMPNVITVGHPTLGAGDRRTTTYLPNGWILRYPSGKITSRSGIEMHKSLVPDREVPWQALYRDTIPVITALEYLDSLNSYEWTDYREIPADPTKSTVSDYAIFLEELFRKW